MRCLPKKKRKKNISSSACFSSKSQWTFHCKYENMEFSLGNTKKKQTKKSMGCLFPCFNPPKHFCFYYYFFLVFVLCLFFLFCFFVLCSILDNFVKWDTPVSIKQTQ